MNDPAKATAANQQANQAQALQEATQGRQQAFGSLQDFLRGQGGWGGIFSPGGGNLNFGTGGMSLADILGRMGQQQPQGAPPQQPTAANTLANTVAANPQMRRPGALPGGGPPAGPARGAF